VSFPGLFRSLNKTDQRTATLSQPHSDEVDVPSFDIRAYKLYSRLVSDVETTFARHQSPFDRWLKEPDPRTSVRRARHDGVEALPNPRFEQ